LLSALQPKLISPNYTVTLLHWMDTNNSCQIYVFVTIIQNNNYCIVRLNLEKYKTKFRKRI